MFLELSNLRCPIVLDIRTDTDSRQPRGLHHSNMKEYAFEWTESPDDASILSRPRNSEIEWQL